MTIKIKQVTTGVEVDYRVGALESDVLEKEFKLSSVRLYEEVGGVKQPGTSSIAQANAQDNKTFVIEGNPAVNQEVAQLCTLIRKMLDERDDVSVAFSNISVSQMDSALAGLKKRDRGITEFDIPRSMSVAGQLPFQWNMDQNEGSQMPQLTAYLLGHLNNDQFKQMIPQIDNVSSQPCIKVRIGEYKFNGKTDLRISLKNSYLNTFMIIQAKKNSRALEKYLSQMQAEFFAAAVRSNYPVVGLLTDTTNWVFVWMDKNGKTLSVLDIDNVDDGLSFLKWFAFKLPHQIPTHLKGTSNKKKAIDYFKFPKRGKPDQKIASIPQRTTFSPTQHLIDDLDDLDEQEDEMQHTVLASYFYNEIQ